MGRSLTRSMPRCNFIERRELSFYIVYHVAVHVQFQEDVYHYNRSHVTCHKFTCIVKTQIKWSERHCFYASIS